MKSELDNGVGGNLRMYLVYYINDDTLEAICLGEAQTLSEAKDLRKVSGDLIFDGSKTINQSNEWLWDNEKIDPHTYACKAQIRLKGIRLRGLQDS